MKWSYQGRKFPSGALAEHIALRLRKPGEEAPIAVTHHVEDKQFCVSALWKGGAKREIFRRSFTTHAGFNQIRDEDGDQ